MVADEWILAMSLSPDDIYRHELAHCLSWPKDHPGARERLRTLGRVGQ